MCRWREKATHPLGLALRVEAAHGLGVPELLLDQGHAAEALATLEGPGQQLWPHIRRTCHRAAHLCHPFSEGEHMGERAF